MVLSRSIYTRVRKFVIREVYMLVPGISASRAIISPLSAVYLAAA